MTLTMKAIHESGSACFLIAGAGKDDRPAGIEAQRASRRPELAMFLRPASARLIWLVDSDAGTELKGID